MKDRPVEGYISETLRQLCSDQGMSDDSVPIILEIPRNKDFGDLSCNVAMIAAKHLGVRPRDLAQTLASVFPTSPDLVELVEIAGPGFLNFRLAPGYFHNLLAEIVSDPNHFGDGDGGCGERWHFEFVSSNPTGPLNIVNARAASVGNTLVNVFKKRGYNAHSEFYVNDTGRQVRLLGASVRVRLAQIEGGEDDSQVAEIPDGGYHGDYVIDIAKDWRKTHPGARPPDDMTLGLWAANTIRDYQEETLKRFRVTYDRWFWESEIYAHSGPEDVIMRLDERDLTYTKDGALYFKASKFGDSEDRVVVTSEGRYTYIVPDIAYHLRKHQRFEKAVNLLGPDHHGHILQLEAALKALGTPKDFFHPIIVQQVNLKRAGQPIKMSKRAGVGITMDELLEEVGVDAARFFFLRRKITSPLDFDIELAKSHSDENPVYYVQYAHARIQSILRQPAVSILANRFPVIRGGDSSTASTIDSLITSAEGKKRPDDPSHSVEPALSDVPCDDRIDLTVLTAQEEMDLLRVMARFPWTLSAVVRGVDPHPLVTYLIDLARAFHSFYAHQRVINDDTCLTVARLVLCRGVACVIAEGLRLIGVDAPDRM